MKPTDIAEVAIGTRGPPILDDTTVYQRFIIDSWTEIRLPPAVSSAGRGR
ncbi:hypothetical protein FB472_0034 [Rhodoglobus vestalii]|uniref:Uncharacterized protein n=1 Tax=Rhodoglobus vestalii TaxID=193384 RepID=A0A8H2PTH4_9MICO|nr:hypothetical protein FB472_0034 [Rhodoglobus vestalii]